jgi:PPOX class probable F420-dependent enzyme
MSTAAPAAIPDTHKDLLERPIVISFVTIMPNGQPQATPTWVDFDGIYVYINSAKGRQKDKNVHQNPNVTILSIDPAEPYHWLEVRGVVEEITEIGAVDLIDKLARKYTKHSKYYGGSAPAERAHQETRITYKIRPTHVTKSAN